MITRLFSVIPPGNRKYPLRYRRALTTIYNRLSYLKFKFLQGGEVAGTRFTVLLSSLATKVPYGTLASMSDDLERYTQEIKFAKNSCLFMFDPAVSGMLARGNLVRGLNSYTKVPEVVLNVDPETPLSQLPFDKSWDVWQELRAVRILYTDSLELVDDMTNGFVNYKVKSPNAVLLSIDPSILIFKYFKYFQECVENGVEGDINLFLKRYEFAHFFEDIFDAWVTNLLCICMRKSDLSADEIVKELVVPKTIAGANVVRELVEGILEYTNLLKDRKIRLQDFFDSPWYFNSSIRGKIEEEQKWCSLPMGRVYNLLDAIHWAPYTELIAQYLRICPDMAIVTPLAEKCRQVWVEQYKYAQSANAAHGQALRTFLSAIDTDIQDCLKQMACQG